MQGALRKVLIDSHVAAIAIAVLFFFSAGQVSSALWQPACEVVSFLITAVAILDIPSMPFTRNYLTEFLLPNSLTDLAHAAAYISAAWLLSFWIYGAGPFRTLNSYRGKLSRKFNT
jgi:hypothetical protein